MKISLQEGITGSKCYLQQLLGETAREAGSGAVIFFNLVVLEREDFCLHHLLTNRWKTFFPSLWFPFCYAMPSRKQELRNLRESREICCSSPVTANSAQTYFKRALGPPWSIPLSSKHYLTAKDHHSLVTFRADSSCSSRYVIYSRANQNGRFHLVSDHCQGLPGPY